uniref:C2H2-type domain-containing protein n=1 Tax=Timema douglasi TaxID=61478 RepID=A0A7R8VKV0_TIMDO|nr:unnamed protein product [Timema douglasi]
MRVHSSPSSAEERETQTGQWQHGLIRDVPGQLLEVFGADTLPALLTLGFPLALLQLPPVPLELSALLHLRLALLGELPRLRGPARHRLALARPHAGLSVQLKLVYPRRLLLRVPARHAGRTTYPSLSTRASWGVAGDRILWPDDPGPSLDQRNGETIQPEYTRHRLGPPCPPPPGPVTAVFALSPTLQGQDWVQGDSPTRPVTPNILRVDTHLESGKLTSRHPENESASSDGRSMTSAEPSCPIRAVRPQRWTNAAAEEGGSYCTTQWTSGMSTPRAITSSLLLRVNGVDKASSPAANLATRQTTLTVRGYKKICRDIGREALENNPNSHLAIWTSSLSNSDSEFLAKPVRVFLFDRDYDGVPQSRPNQHLNLLGLSGGEQSGAALFRQVAQDGRQRFVEPEVKESVDVMFPHEKVLQPAGGRDDDVSPLVPELGHVLDDPSAPYHQHLRQTRDEPQEMLQDLAGLSGQLSRRRDDHRSDLVGRHYRERGDFEAFWFGGGVVCEITIDNDRQIKLEPSFAGEEEIHTELTPSTHDLPSQVTVVSLRCKYSNLEKCLVHSEQRKYKCDVCDKSFKRKSHLNKHLLSHSEQRKYKCDVCEKSFKVKGELNRHLLVHSEQRKYKCDVCEKRFKVKGDLNKHLLIHSEQTKYNCEVCDKSFKVKYNLNCHLLIHSEQRKYKCEVCDKSFKVKGELNRHLLIHSKQRKYKCEVCDKSFKVKYNLNCHLLIHSEQRNFKCNVCDKQFKRKCYLYNHLLVHSEQRKYRCDVCAKSFKMKKNLNRHLFTHSLQRHLDKYLILIEEKRNCKLMGQKENIFLNDSALGENSTRSDQDIIDKKNVCDFKDSISNHNNTKQSLIHTLHRKYTCNVCNRDLKERGSLKKHLLVHSEQIEYKCDVCDKSFKRKGDLNRHLLIHSEQRKYKCNFCDKGFNEKCDLNKHLLYHSERKKYKCNVCDKSFKVIGSLYSHLLVHSDQRKYKCDICDKSLKTKSNLYSDLLIHSEQRNFKLKSNLNRHFFTHSKQRKYKCDVCEKRFKGKGDLNRHLLIHSEQRKYKCDVCEKRFKGKGDLNTHLLIHSEQRKYKCDVCDKSFKVKSNLYSHLLIHSEQRKYKCDVCDKSFKLKKNLNRHLFTHSLQRQYT